MHMRCTRAHPALRTHPATLFSPGTPPLTHHPAPLFIRFHSPLSLSFNPLALTPAPPHLPCTHHPPARLAILAPLREQHIIVRPYLPRRTFSTPSQPQPAYCLAAAPLSFPHAHSVFSCVFSSARELSSGPAAHAATDGPFLHQAASLPLATSHINHLQFI